MKNDKKFQNGLRALLVAGTMSGFFSSWAMLAHANSMEQDSAIIQDVSISMPAAGATQSSPVIALPTEAATQWKQAAAQPTAQPQATSTTQTASKTPATATAKATATPQPTPTALKAQTSRLKTSGKAVLRTGGS